LSEGTPIRKIGLQLPFQNSPKSPGVGCILDGSWTGFLFDIKMLLSEEIDGKPSKCIFF